MPMASGARTGALIRPAPRRRTFHPLNDGCSGYTRAECCGVFRAVSCGNRRKMNQNNIRRGSEW